MTPVGYIKLYRRICSWDWWRDLPTAHLFVHLLLTAEWYDTEYKGVQVPAGCRMTSLRTLAEETGLTVSEVRRAQKKLQKTHEIEQWIDTGKTITKVSKYRAFQASEEKERHTMCTETDTETAHNVTQDNENLPIINIKNEEYKNKEYINNNINIYGNPQKPTLAEIQRFIVENNLQYVDGEEYFKECEARGWKVAHLPIIWRDHIRIINIQRKEAQNGTK